MISEKLAEKLASKIESDYRGMVKPKLSTYIQGILWDRIEADEILHEKAPFLNLIGYTDRGILIRDAKVDRIVEVIIREYLDDGERTKYGLYCPVCESDSCYHVGFALALKEVHKKLVEKGII